MREKKNRYPVTQYKKQFLLCSQIGETNKQTSKKKKKIRGKWGTTHNQPETYSEWRNFGSQIWLNIHSGYLWTINKKWEVL
jgi:hypothetical protein